MNPLNVNWNYIAAANTLSRNIENLSALTSLLWITSLKKAGIKIFEYFLYTAHYL